MTFTVIGNPLSLNHAYPTSRSGRRFPSQALKRWKLAVAWSAKIAMKGATPLKGPVSVRIVAWFDSRRPDLDNVTKPLLDALAGVAYLNDRQVERIELVKELDPANPRAVVTVEEVR